MGIDQILDDIYPLSSSAKELVKELIIEVKFRKGHILLSADKIEKNSYFIKKGMARAFSYKDDMEITFWFGKEGETIISMNSYIADQKGYEFIELLEDCELYELKTEKLKKLFDQDIQIANWGRRFAEQELIKTEERLISRQVRTASERYKSLLIDHPDLIKRVQLGYIANYLGITQVSLSRIRAEKR